MSLSDKQIEILHDHYKDTFARVRETEILRDRLFLGVIGLFALLIIEVGYPAAAGGILGNISIAGWEIVAQKLPLSALLNVSWTLTLVVLLRYCQKTLLVDRQYPYVHRLEKAISPAVGGMGLYQREGVEYLNEYPLFLNIAAFAYGILFPLILIGAASGLATWEYAKVSYSFYHRLFDCLMAAAIVATLIVYRVQPAIAHAWRNGKDSVSEIQRPIGNSG